MSKTSSAQKSPGSYLPRILLAFAAILLLLVIWFYPDAEPETVSPENPDGRMQSGAGEQSEGVPPVESHSDGRCSIDGRVRRGGRGVAARIEVCPLKEGDWLAEDLMIPGPPVREVKASATAGFSAAGLTPGWYEVRATAGDGAFGTARADLASEGARVSVDLVIPDGPHTVRGVAEWSDGRPFRGLVAVGSRRGGYDEVVTGWVSTGAGGQFFVSGLHTGTHRLAACIPGRLRVFSGRIPVPYEGELRYVVDAGMSRVEGRVVVSRTGEAVPDAEVVLKSWSAGSSSLVSRVRADAEGRFHDRALVFRADVEVSAPGFYLVSSESEDADPRIVAYLSRSGEIIGKVTTAAGRPAAGVPVFADFYSDTPVTVSGADGSYSISDVQVYDTRLFATGNGWCSEKGTPVLVPAGGTAHVDLVVVRGATLTGKVLDHEGRPVAGAVVVAGDIWSAQLRVATDREGTFRIESIIPDAEVPLTVDAPGLAQFRTSDPPIGAGQTSDVAIRLPPPRTVGVRVLDALTGAPLAGAVVSYGRQEVATDATGLARLGPLPAGDLELEVFHPDAVRRRIEVGIPAGDTPVAVEVCIERGLTITGRIVMPGGRPFEHGHVWTSWEHSSSYLKLGPGADSGADGRFVVRGLLPGRHSVSSLAMAGNMMHYGEVLAQAGQRDVVIEVYPDEDDDDADEREEEARILVKILGPDGLPVPQCEVILHLKDGEDCDRVGVEALNGTARIFATDDDDFKGQLYVEVCNAKLASGEPLPFGAILIGPLSPHLRETTIVLPRERILKGRVVWPDGEGVPGIDVDADAILPHGLGESVTHGSDRTGADGAFRIGGLGDFEVSLGRGITARPGDPGVVIRREKEPKRKPEPVAPLHVVRGRVLLASGLPATRCRIWLDYRDPIRPFYDGTFVIRDLPAGSHQVQVLPDGLSRWEEEANAWEMQTIVAPDDEAELTLDPGWALRVRVRNWPSGAGEANAFLYSENGSQEFSEVLREGGSLLFRRLPSGSRYTLFISPVSDGYFLLRRGIHSGESDLVVDLERGLEISGRIEKPTSPDRVEVEAEFLDDPWFKVAGEVRVDGTFTIRGLPEGRWKVKATGWVGDESKCSAHHTVRTGEVVLLRLE